MESILASHDDSKTMIIKLLIGTKSQRVVYAESGKDFIDFLFTMPQLPLSSAARLLSQHGMVGSLGNLHSSIEKFSDANMQPSKKKDNLLKPKFIALETDGRLLASPSNAIFACLTCSTVSVEQNLACPDCFSAMKREMKFAPRPTWEKPSDQETGYVKGMTYLITDDLEVKPMSTLSSLTLLKKLNIKDGGLEEKVVNLDRDACLKLLKASLHSNTVLTDVFLIKSNGARPSATKRKVEHSLT